jgi:hypothetical protein
MLDLTISVRRVAVLAAALAATVGALAAVAQVKTNVPDVVAGARLAIVERITIHGKALEGNLEGDAVDRDAIVFLPPGYIQNRTRRYPVLWSEKHREWPVIDRFAKVSGGESRRATQPLPAQAVCGRLPPRAHDS